MGTDPTQHPVPPGGPASQTDPNAQQDTAHTEAGGLQPGETADTDSGTQSLADLQDQLCPNCHTGVLYVKRYDPEALHEAGQLLTEQHQKPSGGAYEVMCFQCGFGESRALGSDA